MLLTITNELAPATDLGYLLHKNPSRAQAFDLPFGRAHVYYTESSPERCTAALLLEVDPVGLVRGRGAALSQYVNDRPYAASSFLSVAISRVFGSALSGKSRERPETAEAALPLRARLAVVPCRGGEGFLRRLFEPLGYAVSAEPHAFDGAFPEWGESPYFTVERPHDDLLDIDDVLGKRIVTTTLQRNVTIREENAAAALEVMSRFAADPRWLVYLPPTVSPSDTSKKDLLEHPAEALAYYRREGVPRVICEEKHMGSRAIAIVCRDEDAAARRFGTTKGAGIIYTRTGRRFFEDRGMEEALLDRLRRALSATGMWEEFTTDWFCLDCEVLPWSAKAGDLIRDQYAAVGAAASGSLAESVSALEEAAGRGLEVSSLLEGQRERQDDTRAYVEAYGRYSWPVRSVEDVRLAPFHLLASEGEVHTDRDHRWHLEKLTKLCREDEVLLRTSHLEADTSDPEDEEKVVAWWEELTGPGRGGEGMVVKPLDFVAKGRRGIAQPGVKCRGREYLRLVYGPEYTAPANLNRLRQRNLSAKRSLALREFALGAEALERFVRRDPLYSIHECVFGVLALESEPVDPRL